MTKKPMVSVVIPAYNAAETIAACLKSLKKQTYQPLKIIVVDDGSNDDTAKIVKQFNNVTLLTQEHSGAGRARNKGALKAGGEILVLVDADQEFAPEFVADLVKPILTGEAKGTWSGEEMVKNWDNVWARCFNYNFGRYTPEMVTDHSSQRKVFRAILTSEFNKVGGFDPIGYNDDWTLVNKLGYEPKSTRAASFHRHPDNISSVFAKAVWMGQRPYKLGPLGNLATIIKHNAAFSLLSGLLKSLKTKTPQFILFKLTFDLGLSWGALSYLFGRRYH